MHNRRRTDRVASERLIPKRGRAQVIEIDSAIASKISSRWTRPIRERIYRDFLRGVDPKDLRVSYRDPVFGAPKVQQIVDVIREEGQRVKRVADAGKYAGLIEIRRAA